MAGILACDDPRMAELPDDVRALFEGANYAHIATMLPDGGPHSVPVWVGLEGDRIAFFTPERSRKARNLAADPRVAFSITDHDNPYRMAQVRGRVAELIRGEPALEIVDRISNRYTGQPFPLRSVTIYLVEPETASAVELGFEHAPPG
jgi:PPOX class probable F420-dependent enzyme